MSTSTPNKDPFRITQHFKGVQLQDITGFILLSITLLPGIIWKLFRPDIWVISEYEDDARDNGYWLFRYIRENHPKMKVYYPINRSSSDYAKVARLGNVVRFSSLKHYLLFWAASKYAGSTKLHGFPSPKACDFLHLHNFTSFKYIFLNHGVARGYSAIVDGTQTNYEMIVAISETEKKTIELMNNQPSNKVKAIGFCRHDNLDDRLLQKNLIVFMPTWRKWLDPIHVRNKKGEQGIKKNFLKSEYYQRCQELMASPRLIQLLEEGDLKFIFYLHKFAQPFAEYLIPASSRIIVANKEDFFVQDLLKRAAFLITDYSSVIFDFAYMKKPCCYYQFDKERFAREQYDESDFFTYERDGFGPILLDCDEVTDELRRSYENGFTMDDKYRRRVEKYFPSFDKRHCERTYKLIRSL